jgi:limonene-1,2-epoxide hydrolase
LAPVRSEVQVSETPESVARRFLAGWETSKPNLDELLAFFAEDAVFIDGPSSEYRGVQAIRDQFQNMVTMLGSLKIQIRTLVANGNCVMVERVEAVEVQGHPFEIPGVVVFEFDDERRIKQLREYFDLHSIMEHLSATVSPAD